MSEGDRPAVIPRGADGVSRRVLEFRLPELFLHPLDPEGTARLAADIFTEAHDHLPDALRELIEQRALR